MSGRVTCGQRLRGPQRGSVLPLIAVGIVLCGLLLVGLGQLGSDAVARAQAQTAADAAALAGAAAGEQEARDVAADNGGELVGYAVLGTDVVVEVRVGPATAVARARRVGPLSTVAHR